MSISTPTGDYTIGVDPRWIESHIATADLPTSAATVMFAAGTPREIVDLLAQQAVALGSGEVSTWEEPWSPEEDSSPGMVMEHVDERDSGWEEHGPRFRVYLFEQSGFRVADDGSQSPGYATTTWDVTGADIVDVLGWAQHQAGDRGLYSVALVADGYDEQTGRGLVWLVGMDYEDTPTDQTRSVLRRMLRRRGTKVVNPR